MLESQRLFWREFREHFHTTGALLPSGRFLGRALVRFVREPHQSRQILEVGPGTGAVTRHIVRAMQSQDALQLVEINRRFARHLRRQLRQDPLFSAAATRIRVIEDDVANLGGGARYDVIVSGLPLNNFPAATVRALLASMMALLRPGGTLSFFQYVGVRKMKWMFGGPHKRREIREVGQVLNEWLRDHECARDVVPLNVPPAWVHHLRREPRQNVQP